MTLSLETGHPTTSSLTTHIPFALKALVTAGQMWLTVDGVERELQPGDLFELSHSQPHAERYGQTGASYLVARRHQADTN
ncbi:MAG: hypothetical protein RL043_1011 [Pseudomonadota bacterium]